MLTCVYYVYLWIVLWFSLANVSVRIVQEGELIWANARPHQGI